MFKRILSTLLAVLFSFALCACSVEININSKEDSDSKQESTQTSPVQTEHSYETKNESTRSSGRISQERADAIMEAVQKDADNRADIYYNPQAKQYAYIADPDTASTVPVKNGEFFIVPYSERIAPLTVSVKGEYAYYVYLKSLSASKNDNMAFYVSPNSTVDVKVPIGTYQIYYCCGEKWYGLALKFGEQTQYYKVEEIFSFSKDTNNA